MILSDNRQDIGVQPGSGGTRRGGTEQRASSDTKEGSLLMGDPTVAGNFPLIASDIMKLITLCIGQLMIFRVYRQM